MQVRVDLSDELLMLDEFLCSEAVSDESMLSSEVDGFFAGLNFYATPVEPDEWLPWVWNGETPHFEDEAQADAVTRALLALHDDVFRRLERGEWGPIFATDLDESAVRSEERRVGKEWRSGGGLCGWRDMREDGGGGREVACG